MPVRSLSPMLCLFLLARTATAQFVDLTAQIEMVFWSEKQARTETRTTRCIVGTNAWLLVEPSSGTRHHTWIFNGSNLIKQTLSLPYASKFPALFERNHPELIGSQARRYTNAVPFFDQNPFRPVGVADIPWAVETKLSWVAFCSGSMLRREGRRLFPPIDLWKQHIDARSGFVEKTTRFEDDIGLPSRMELFADRQVVFQYSVSASTNLMNCTVPLEFVLVQYRPAESHGWRVYFTAKGTVTAIRPATELKLPLESDRAAAKIPDR